ncbi:hypothetical protein JTE90_001365 [Oedothorax gibbosus]|uniref:Uncharacterized protein n=1 Tax=Oedothorax gibbosus TaxID=931172 RepID=A0AAV6VEW0_9ARAC|nr:hypothetical protein JTE90_001365 [Oedothorax gibbosus]
MFLPECDDKLCLFLGYHCISFGSFLGYRFGFLICVGKKMDFSTTFSRFAILYLTIVTFCFSPTHSHHYGGGGNSGLETLLAAGILAKLLSHKHHHGHHQHIPIHIPYPVHHGGHDHHEVHHDHHGHHHHGR